MPVAANRAKFAYINKEDITEKINNGELDSYDIVYTKDTHENIIITPDLELCSISNKVYVYNSEEEANAALNYATDTYDGQIVSIKIGSKYRGYIVNSSGTEYYATPLWEHDGSINYDDLANVPIKNIKSIGSTLVISTLENGNYSFVGLYKISNNDTTTRSISEPIILMVRHDTLSGSTNIKQISNNSIIDYTDNGTELTSNIYVTSEYLSDNNYATEGYVDNKIASLHFFTEEEAKDYIDSVLDETLDGRIATWVDLHLASYDDIDNLLNN